MTPPTEQRAVFVWEEMRSDEFEVLDRMQAVVVLPTGAIEQHGPHLPVNTDTATATAIARRAAARTIGIPVLVAPTVACGVSPFHMYRPGTMTLRVETFLSIVSDLCDSIIHNGFRRIVVLNGHGGNTGPLQTLALMLSARGIRVAVMTYWEAIPDVIAKVCDGDQAMGHGSDAETSIQLALQPHLVDESRITRDLGTELRFPPGLDARATRGTYVVPDFRRYVPGGVLGRPAGASREKGELLLEAAADALARLIAEWARAEVSD
jgi:creatinine amidohydrolase